jgi:hypothetical protein
MHIGILLGLIWVGSGLLGGFIELFARFRNGGSMTLDDIGAWFLAGLFGGPFVLIISIFNNYGDIIIITGKK